MFRVMRPDFADILPGPRSQGASDMQLGDDGMRPRVCHSICTGSQQGGAFVSPFLHGCISLPAVQHMKAKACYWEDNDQGHRNNRYTRFPENDNDAVIVRINIMQMLLDDKIRGVLDMSSNDAVKTSL